MRNPDWVRDEIILAMDLYFRAGRKQLAANNPNVARLSRLLKRLPIHPPDARDESFRNPTGISMILGNFLAIDPIREQSGLSRHNRIHATVWRDFIDDLPVLRRTAEAIELCVNNGVAVVEPLVALSEDGFTEGALLTALHTGRERNRTLVERKKRQVLAAHGQLECEVCGFDFEKTYGDLGRGFAECHHMVPLARGAFDRKTRLIDLAIVCANCHRMLHHARPALTVVALRDRMSDIRGRRELRIEERNATANLP